jgi:hypothetical protein
MIITKHKTILAVQEDFGHEYPYLKLEFYQPDIRGVAFRVKDSLPGSTPLQAAELTEDNGVVEIHRDMLVEDLENAFLDKFGLDVQVSRRSGMIWLETTMTASWTLEKQNQHGYEISLLASGTTF